MTIQRQKEGYKITAGTGMALLTPERVVITREDQSSFTVENPGEYDVAQMFVELQELGGHSPAELDSAGAGEAGESGTGRAVVLESEGFSLVYLPKPPRSLSEEELKEYESVDVLIVPGSSKNIVDQLAPPVVIPMNASDELVKALGVEMPEGVGSLKLKLASDLPEETEVVILG